MKKYWWKALSIVLILYSLIAGILAPVPTLPIINETIRILYYHLPMWFTMFTLYFISVIYSIRYLSSGRTEDDLIAVESVNVGILFCFLGLGSGMIWGNYSWGDPWPNDAKLNGSAIATLMYLAYLVLRNALEEEQKRGKISAIYNVFAFPVMIVLMYILPKTTDSLHPGSGGNSGFGEFDMDGAMRAVLYPAALGWILMGLWLAQIRYRIRKLQIRQD